MLREIVLDTETTGFDHAKGDRLIEIGCVELLNRIPTGREFHKFINPLRNVPAEAQAVHGITTEFLLDKPVFGDVADEFLSFISEDVLVIHNASFDIGFLNSELTRSSRPTIAMTRVVDTLALARRKHPAGPNSLDALCKRYGIDNTLRTKHGALLDSLLLAEVYIELLGERQASLGLSAGLKDQLNAGGIRSSRRQTPVRPVGLPQRLSREAEVAHLEFIDTLGSNVLWKAYLGKVSDKS